MILYYIIWYDYDIQLYSYHYVIHYMIQYQIALDDDYKRLNILYFSIGIMLYFTLISTLCNVMYSIFLWWNYRHRDKGEKYSLKFSSSLFPSLIEGTRAYVPSQKQLIVLRSLARMIWWDQSLSLPHQFLCFHFCHFLFKFAFCIYDFI